MSAETDVLLERLAQSRKWRESAARVNGALARSSGPAVPGGFAPGDRVFDTISGEEGEVLDGTRENVVIPTAK